MEITPLQMHVAMTAQVDLYDLAGVNDAQLTSALTDYVATMTEALGAYATQAAPHNTLYAEAYQAWRQEWQARRAAGESITLYGQGQNSFWQDEPAHPHDRILKRREEALTPFRAALEATRDTARAHLVATCRASRSA